MSTFTFVLKTQIIFYSISVSVFGNAFHLTYQVYGSQLKIFIIPPNEDRFEESFSILNIVSKVNYISVLNV